MKDRAVIVVGRKDVSVGVIRDRGSFLWGKEKDVIVLVDRDRGREGELPHFGNSRNVEMKRLAPRP